MGVVGLEIGTPVVDCMLLGAAMYPPEVALEPQWVRQWIGPRPHMWEGGGLMSTQPSDSRRGCSGHRAGLLPPPSFTFSHQIVCQCACILELDDD